MNVRETVAAVFADVAREQRKTLAPLRDDLPLLESGLDSLCLAIIVATLETKLGVDPLSAGEDVAIPATFGEFVDLYAHAVA